jgi:hypothetical protein
LKNGTNYTEASVGIENILKVIRVDYIRSFASDNNGTNGVRITIPVFNNKGERD